ncbi:hypothetical protein SLEP1_g58812 [Rubroshorea leprosula]|uniref:Uncharacterized protein n=1 Tax=Rubroshorea leprosula TaxID=152421 RepID=A0AAV5MQJ1_9ROSI|nr:hypothetical protein SLEP1_g58812 [Rubroshorea leprosula]
MKCNLNLTDVYGFCKKQCKIFLLLALAILWDWSFIF